MMDKLKYSAITFLFFLLLSSCSKMIPIGDYDSAEVGKIKKVVPGKIISIRPVRLHNQNEDHFTNQSTATATQGFTRSHGFEYVVRLSNGSIISVVQSENIKLKNNQHILVIYGANTRVVPDNSSDDY